MFQERGLVLWTLIAITAFANVILVVFDNFELIGRIISYLEGLFQRLRPLLNHAEHVAEAILT